MGARPKLDLELDCGLFWPDGTAKSFSNSFNWRTVPPERPDTTREDIAARGGYASVAAKHRRGQELMPALHLKGSTPRPRRSQPAFEESEQ